SSSSWRRPAAFASGLAEGFDSGQLAPLQELEEGAPRGREVPDPVGDAGAADRGDRVTAAHDRKAAHAGHRQRHAVRPLREGGALEDPHRAIPDDGPRRTDEVAEAPN